MPKKRKTLVVDDDRSVREYLSDFLGSRGYEVRSLGSGKEALDRLEAGEAPDVVLLDMMMPEMNGLEVLERSRAIQPSVPVVVLSALGHIKDVVNAMRAGASDYLVKPFEEEELEMAIDNALEKHDLQEEIKGLRVQLERRVGQVETELHSTDERVLRIQDIARQVARTDVPVLILGESGVGKEVLARYIHAQSERSARSFVKVNCAALPHDLLESELFGHERGAFTGAFGERPGKFELADEGSILLDEIGEMSPHLQAKFLHVLQDNEYSRLGARRPVKIDVRVFATTNRDLEKAIAKGEFREDVYFRLAVIKLTIPPLRERRGDIPVLCEHFLQKYRTKYGSPVKELPAELVDGFLAYDWPGNVRQLENAVKRYVVLPDIEVSLSELKKVTPVLARAPQRPASLKQVAAQAAEEAEKRAVRQMLEETKWNRKAAARRLNISYKALLNKLKKWELDNRKDPKRLGLEL